MHDVVAVAIDPCSGGHFTQDGSKERDNTKKKEQQSLTKIGHEINIRARNKDKNYNKIGHRLQCH